MDIDGFSCHLLFRIHLRDWFSNIDELFHCYLPYLSSLGLPRLLGLLS
jgi:hypothetical protein